MRRAWLLVLFAAAACTGDDGGGTAVDPDDVDADGIPNATDICPMTRDPAQHDDDGDGLGDACDNCPATPNPDQADTTELEARQFPDGVGDVCDRRPKVADDKIARFFPFADPAEANAFTGTGWTIADDRARGTDARWASTHSERGDGITLQAKIGKFAWSAPEAAVTVVVDGDGVASGFTCAIERAVTGDQQLALHQIGGASTSMPIDAIRDDDLVVLTVSRAYTQLPTGKAACFVKVGTGPELRIDIDTIDDLAIGSYALATAGADVEVLAATVMTTPFACDAPLTGGAAFSCPTPP